MILAPLQKLPKNIGDLGKLIVAKGFKWLPKVQYIAQSGHTACAQIEVLLRSGKKLLQNYLKYLATFRIDFRQNGKNFDKSGLTVPTYN